jgi:hypothetical protein
MATCYLSEYAAIGTAVPERHANQAPKEPSLNEQNIPINASPTSSAPFSALTRMVMISVDSVCSIRFGGIAASTTYKRVPANFVGVYGVSPGDSLSVVQNV